MATFDKKQIWHDVLENIKVSVSSANFSTWFSQTYLAEIKDGGKRFVSEVGCSSSFIKATIETRYFGLIQDALQKALGSPTDVLFIVKQELKQEKETPSPLFEASSLNYARFETALAKSKLRPIFTFDSFAVSPSNQMAWAAAEAVSNNPGTAYNPLFIWGGVGVGKTHLMSAVGHVLLKKDSDSSLLFCTGEEFTNEIVEGIRNKTTPSFRNKYRKLKVLLIDDIQFIAGKDTVQEEFFHTFNALVSTGSQVILTSDRPPSEIARLEGRLKSRFEAGLIVDIGEPDFELRCAILQIKAKQKGIDIPTHIVHLIAGNVDAARKIEGFLIRLISEVSVNKKEVNEELIESLLGKGESDNPQKIKSNPSEVINAVSRYFSIGKRKLLGESRVRPIAQPRQILMYILRTQLLLPLEEVGHIVGNRDHTTVMHAVEKITHLASDNVQVREDLRGIKNML